MKKAKGKRVRKEKWPPKDWEQFKVWLVWVRKERPNGLENVDLRSVCKTKDLAELHRDVIIRDEKDASGVWVEERDANHLYAQRDVRLAFRLLDVPNKWMRDA